MLNYKIASLLGLLEMSQFALLSQNIGLGLCVCRVCFQLRLSFKAGDSSCASFIPPKIVWFSLTLLKSKLLPGLVWWKIITSDRLQTIHPGYYLSPQIYSLSDNGPETVDHLFIHRELKLVFSKSSACNRLSPRIVLIVSQWPFLCKGEVKKLRVLCFMLCSGQAGNKS